MAFYSIGRRQSVIFYVNTNFFVQKFLKTYQSY